MHRTVQLQAMCQITQVAGGDTAHPTGLDSRIFAGVTLAVHTLVALRAFSEMYRLVEAVSNTQTYINLRWASGPLLRCSSRVLSYASACVYLVPVIGLKKDVDSGSFHGA